MGGGFGNGQGCTQAGLQRKQSARRAKGLRGIGGGRGLGRGESNEKGGGSVRRSTGAKKEGRAAQFAKSLLL